MAGNFIDVTLSHPPSQVQLIPSGIYFIALLIYFNSVSKERSQKLRDVINSFVMYVHLSVCKEKLGPHWMVFHEI
jgi:hypothetical protein